MKLKISNDILEAIDHNRDLIDSEEFVFSKAKDALDEFMAMDISKEKSDEMLVALENYKQFIARCETDEIFQLVSSKINHIVSYCDTNAKDKLLHNKYSDKRIIARASVRQKHWIKGFLHHYRVSGDLITPSIRNALTYITPSVRNALTFIKNPQQGIPILSENHRKMVSENIMEKSYQPETFVDDLIEYFMQFDLPQPKNRDNLTRLISEILYRFEDDWKDEIIALMASDDQGWQEQLINPKESFDAFTIWNIKRPNGTGNTIKKLRQILDEEGSFYLYYTVNNKVKYRSKIVDFAESGLLASHWFEQYNNVIDFTSVYKEFNVNPEHVKITFLAERMEKIITPVDSHDFKFYNSSIPNGLFISPVASVPKTITIEKQKLGETMEKYIKALIHKKQIILQGPPGTGKTYSAKDIAELMISGEVSPNKKDQKQRLESSDQFCLTQFHPSYSYEDFVRGIVAESCDDGISYTTQNKTLAEFAERAKNNFIEAQRQPEELSHEQHILNLIKEFAEIVENEIEEHGSYRITDAVDIVEVHEDAFRYKGNWNNSQRMKFSDLMNIQKSGADTRQAVKRVEGISGLGIQHSSYFHKVSEDFRNRFAEKLKHKPKETTKVELKNYVLIIDEINRANLPSVLGELIYALEYRGEAVESMYDIEGNRKLVLPENLYIIGTMNTADRSIGHIDYAIRRRFAFIEVLPQREIIPEGEAQDVFDKVSQLFIEKDGETMKNSKHLSPNFGYKEIQLGHSYFMSDNLSLSLKYEIKPILQEYVKDGILLSSASEIIESLHVEEGK